LRFSVRFVNVKEEVNNNSNEKEAYIDYSFSTLEAKATINQTLHVANFSEDIVESLKQANDALNQKIANRTKSVLVMGVDQAAPPTFSTTIV
jgi:predicted P-loop ATPase/GTPase